MVRFEHTQPGGQIAKMNLPVNIFQASVTPPEASNANPTTDQQPPQTPPVPGVEATPQPGAAVPAGNQPGALPGLPGAQPGGPGGGQPTSSGVSGQGAVNGRYASTNEQPVLAPDSHHRSGRENVAASGPQSDEGSRAPEEPGVNNGQNGAAHEQIG